MMRHPRRGWEFPGGQVEAGEDLITALKREIKEETGIVVRVGRLVCINSNIKPEGPIPTKVMFDFIAKATGGKLVTSIESPEVGWFDRGEVLAMITHPMIRDRMRVMLANKPMVIYRTYSKNPYVVHMQTTIG